MVRSDPFNLISEVLFNRPGPKSNSAQYRCVTPRVIGQAEHDMKLTGIGLQDVQRDGGILGGRRANWCCTA